MFQYSFLLKPVTAFLFCSIILLFSGCGGPTPPPPTIEPNFNYSITVDDTPEIRIAGSAFEVSTNNCGNPVSTIETFSKSREFNASVEFGLTEAVIGEVGGGVAKVAEAKLGAEVGASLKIGIGSTEKVEASRQIETPPDSRTTIKLQWEEVWAKGNISVRRTNDTVIGNIPFFALTTMSLSQKEVKTIICGTVVPPLPTTPSQPSTPVVIEQATIRPLPIPTNTPVPPILSPTSLLYNDPFDSSTGWNMEEGMKIENGSLIIYPGYDAVPKNPAKYTDFVFESRFYVQDSGSMAFYLRHQPCADWNCSIQIALYFGNENTVAARRFLGATQGKQFDIMKGSIASVIRPNDWNTIAIGAKGNTYEVVLNDDFVFKFTDETYTSGAFIIDNAGPNEVKIDYVRIYDVQ